MTENREAIGGNLGGKYLVREREGSRDAENAVKNEETIGEGTYLVCMEK